MRGRPGIAVALTAAMLSVAAACSTKSASLPGGHLFRGIRLTRTVILGDGGLVVRPYLGQLPFEAVQDIHSLGRTVRSSDPLLWQNTGVKGNGVTSLSQHAVIGRVTVAPGLLPKQDVGRNTLAVLLFYRLHLDTNTGCTSGFNQAPAAQPSGSWSVYVTPILRYGVSAGVVGYPYLYTPTIHATCGSAPARVQTALPHASVPWRLKRRHGRQVTISYWTPCDQARLWGPQPDPDRTGAWVAQVILAVGDVGCPTATSRTLRFTLPVATRLLHGPVGYLPLIRIPVVRR